MSNWLRKAVCSLVVSTMLIANMAFGAITATVEQGPFVAGDRKVVIGTVNLGVYATNGIAVTPANLGLSIVQEIQIQEAGGLNFYFDKTNSKIKAYSGGVSAFTPAGTIAITPHSDSAGTPAGSVAITPHADSAGTPAGTIAVTPHDDSAGTPAGTNAASITTAMLFNNDSNAITWPALALVHNADPVGGLTAAALYAKVVTTPYFGQAYLESNQAATTNTTFSSSNDGAFYNTGSARAYGHVLHNATPSGVAIFVDEADSDKLKANFTGAGAAGDKYIPLRLDAGVAWLKIIDADTAGMKALYYDDNGADNAKLIYVDTGAAGGVVAAANKAKGCSLGLLPDTSSQSGIAVAQTFTGTALGTHSHASTAAFTGTAMGTHDHASTAAFTGSALGTHNHASTAAFTGTAVAATVASEVGNTTDLSNSGYTARFIAIGR